MAKVARKSIDVAGSVILSGRTTVIVNDTPIASEGDAITPHMPSGPHNGAVIVGYWPSVIAEDRPIARKGDPVSCGHVIATGSDNVFAGTDGNG
jgi:uncharacterized Zn-binding protein involved in type VI secretion